MQVFTEINIKWLGESVPCPDNNLMNKDYEFYSECEIDNVKFEAGIGAIVRIESVPHVGVIHYFYEIPHSVPKIKKYIVAFELFYKPKEIKSSLAKPIELDNDLEVVKKDKVVLVHLPIYAIKSRCILIYGLQDEDPQEVLHEFLHTTEDTIYVCRYVASIKYGLYHLKGAIYNEDDKNISNSSTIIISEDEPSPDALAVGKYSVTQVENIASNIKMKLKRDLSSPDKITKQKHVPLILSKKKQESPSELMKNLRLSPKKHIPSQELVKSINKRIFDEEPVQTSSYISSDVDISTEEDRCLVVVLNKIDMKVESTNAKKCSKVQTRRSSRVKTVEYETSTCPTPTRSSRRQTSRISYSQFYEIVSPRTKLSETFDDYAVSTPRSRRKQNLVAESKRRNTVIFNDNESPIKKIHEKQKTVEDTPSKTKKNSVPSVETPRKTKKDTEKPNSVGQKRTVPSSVEVTPKKQSRIMNTPKSGRRNIMTMTPTVEEREEPIVFCDTPMSRARMGLSAYTMPSKLPCRENEYLNIYNFITGRLRDQSSGCMYISGVPGTGKTMTVCRVMSDLSEEKDEFSDFVFLKLNALALTEPRQIYVEIVKKLLNQKLHWEESLKEMERFFKAKKKKIPHVILVDELDKLCNRKQDVIYNLLDLPFHSVTPLIVITIANTMDLPERILTNKVNSRLGLVRLTFKPYQYKDLVKIVTERLAADAVFKNEALELVARKVAAVSGDARRALAMCSRGTEIAEEENKELVTMDVVDRVIKEMSSSSKVQAIQCCSKLEQLILTSIANEVTRTGNEEVPFLNVLHNLEQLCLLESFKLPAAEVCLRSCHNLGSFRLLITQHGRVDINMTLMLNISTDDIHYALRN